MQQSESIMDAQNAQPLFWRAGEMFLHVKKIGLSPALTFCVWQKGIGDYIHFQAWFNRRDIWVTHPAIDAPAPEFGSVYLLLRAGEPERPDEGQLGGAGCYPLLNQSQ